MADKVVNGGLYRNANAGKEFSDSEATGLTGSFEPEGQTSIGTPVGAAEPSGR